jgi:hypothetical protein
MRARQQGIKNWVEKRREKKRLVEIVPKIGKSKRKSRKSVKKISLGNPSNGASSLSFHFNADIFSTSR